MMLRQLASKIGLIAPCQHTHFDKVSETDPAVGLARVTGCRCDHVRPCSNALSITVREVGVTGAPVR